MAMKKRETVFMVASGKGGVGKSCLTVTIGRELARLGQKTLLIEMELGLGVFDLMMDLERGVCCLSDFLSGRCAAKDCILPVPDEPGLWAALAPNEQDFFYDPAVFAEKTNELAGSFDFILIETPPGFGSWFEAAQCAADAAIIVATPDLPCLRDARAVSDRLDEQPRIRQWLVVNRLDVKRFFRRRPIPHLDFAIDTVGAQLLGVVPEDLEVSYCLNGGTALPQQNGAKMACRNIALRLLGQTVELGV